MHKDQPKPVIVESLGGAAIVAAVLGVVICLAALLILLFISPSPHLPVTIACVILLSAQIYLVVCILVQRKRLRLAKRLQTGIDLAQQVMLNSMTDICIIYDTSLKIVWANETAARSLNKTVEELTGKHCYEMWRNASAPCKDCPCQTALKSGQPEATDMLLQNGEWRRLNVYPIIDEHNRITNVIEFSQDITASKESELRRETEKQRFYDILELFPGFVYLMRDDNTIAYANRRFQELFGDPEGHTCHELLVGADEQCAGCPTKQTLLTGLKTERQWRRSADQYYQIYDNRYIDADGEIFVLEIGVDITEREHALADLQEAKTTAERYFQIAGVMLLVLGPDGKVIHINQRGCEMLGCSSEEIIGKNWFDSFLPEDIREEFRMGYRDMMRGADLKPQDVFPEGREHAILTTSGEVRYMLWHNSVIRDDDGSFVSSLSSGEDITDQLEVLRELEQSESRYRAIVTALPDVILRVGLDGILVDLWIGGETRMKLNRNCKPGDHVRKLGLPSEHEEQARILLEKTLTTQHLHLSELTWSDENDSGFFELRMSPCGFNEAVVFIRDITERKRYQEEIEKSLQEKEALLREIHHRVKNNLQVVMSLLNMQCRQSCDDNLKQLVTQSRERIRAISLIHEKLYNSESISRISFVGYVRDLTRMLQGVYSDSARNVFIDVDGEGVILCIDQAMPCALIINELVTNALKHAFPDDRQGRINIVMTNSDGRYCLRVSDDGVGIAPERVSASGLGLNLVDMLVRQLDGSMERETAGGAAYTIRFSNTGRD